jgi:S-adenosylmethionine/arginine decarboxylase-like enzyme
MDQIRVEEGAQALGSVERGLCGSTVIRVDAYLDKGSKLAIAQSPDLLQQMVRKAIDKAGMTWLDKWRYVWEPNEQGHNPFTTMDCLAESHVVTAVAGISNLRAETWPEVLYVQMDVQLCDYSRPNYHPAVDLSKDVTLGLDPKCAYLQIMRRGPLPGPMEIGDQLEYTRAKGFVVIRKGTFEPPVPKDEYEYMNVPVGVY